MVYWFTGLPGAGKTTLGKLFYEELSLLSNNVCLLDGDELREVLGGVQDYSIQGRKLLAMRYARLCKLLDDQGLTVVCCTVSMFSEIWTWNRKNITNYTEIYVKVPIDLLIQRDQKGLYSNALDGNAENVMGINLEYDEPHSPDITVINTGINSPIEVVGDIFRQLT